VPLNDAILNVGANAMRSQMAWLSLHSAVPDASGSDESIADRRPSAWAPPTTGDLSSASVAFTGGEPNGPIKAVGFWNDENVGTFWGYFPVGEGDVIFNGSGDYVVGAFTLVGSSS
jgi:hypothetical protein